MPLNTDMRKIDFKDMPRTRHGEELCDSCGNYNVCRTPTLTECSKFKPLIGFAPPFGTMTGEFNTIRLGKAWLKRIEPGSTVTLYDNRKKEIIGDAEVVAIDAGTKKRICYQHGHKNHQLIGKKITKKQAGKDIERILINANGRMYYEHAKALTSIVLRRNE